ncbi:Usherin [Fukomys damarensis]|uniref:Usherin n=1 Tax=Fukomys damarensis TaxID=885580 RepID=A0A091CZZ9_FUKDA|nr:Usherin [Fukomys damarensis]
MIGIGPNHIEVRIFSREVDFQSLDAGEIIEGGKAEAESSREKAGKRGCGREAAEQLTCVVQGAGGSKPREEKSDKRLQYSATGYAENEKYERMIIHRAAIKCGISASGREVLEVFSGDLPRLHVQSHCRCPGSHPRVHPLLEQYCVPNGAEDTARSRVLRLNPDAHPLSFVNDNDIGTSWVSHVFTNSAQLDRGVTISVDLENGPYQVFYIVIQFFSPQPTAIRIQRKKEDSLDWEDWQYFARNCSTFGMENNGDLENPDSVNCLQLSKFTPYSRGNVTFSILTPEPKHRPGYSDFYKTPALQEFVKATQIRLHFHGQYHTADASVNPQHRYYAVAEITIGGRCQCHGHASRCDMESRPYRCLCSRESFTEGRHCDRCLLLYNAKPFRAGDPARAFSCKPCQCHSHAESCHYDASLDPFPLEHGRGGGGVCDACQHNTAGRNCELCQDYFFRQVGADPSAVDVCKPCDCDAVGTRNRSLSCDQLSRIPPPDADISAVRMCGSVGGQCHCKRHVSGRQCNGCLTGFYGLHEPDAAGCRPCGCNAWGTVDGDITCHPDSGQCKCKANVIGLKCDRCNFGFKFLRSLNGDGCEPCQCNLQGSVNKVCDPFSGQCDCKDGARGLRCDTCRENYYGLGATGCKACACDAAGSVPGTVCDAETGQCACKPSFGGRQCKDCLEGYFYLPQNDSFRCLPCDCDTSGTVSGSSVCDKATGQCPCKSGVTGRLCSQCEPHRYSVTVGSFRGCWTCDCDSLGTLPGTTCEPVRGQCPCLPNRQGRRCHQCQPGFYVAPGNAPGCLPCSCHATGAAGHVCDGLTGQCLCRDVSLTGRDCDQCGDRYFGFDPQAGRCQPCNCHLSGASNETCHSVTGQCFCKPFVTGTKCEACVPGASHLDVSNPWGCSKTPCQQSPPRGEVQSSSAISLSWSPPDSPNGPWLMYSLFRDGSEIYTSEDQYPYSAQYFIDTALSPYTSHSYHIEATNVQGSTRSAAVIYTTKPGLPQGHLSLNCIVPVGPDSVTLAWSALSSHSGRVERYVVSCAPLDNLTSCAPYEGLETTATIWNLAPFTEYQFSVQACTSRGCIQGSPITVTTGEAPPQRLSPPEVRKVSATELHVEWTPPGEPNGIVIKYELYMKTSRSTGELRVFQSSGWQPAAEDAQRPPQTAAAVTGLEPYTEYAFRVAAWNAVGSVSSAWISERTGEAAPVFMPPPSVSPLSSHSLRVSWEKPPENVTRGKVAEYHISMVSEPSPWQSAPVLLPQLLHTAQPQELSYTVQGLKPYRIYMFTISLCNSVGCVTSASGAGQTLAAAPAQLRPPLVKEIDSSTIHLTWLPPEEVNGPLPLYQLERRASSLPAPVATMMKGTRFPGNGYYKFPSTTHPIGPNCTGIKASFRTRVSEGLILFAATPGNQEGHCALQLKNGRPYFLFDPQGSPVEVTTTTDHGKQYSDDRWHEIIAVRHETFVQITLDGQYTGSSAALKGSTIIRDDAGLFVGGLPLGYTIPRRDPEITQKGFVGCLKDVHFMKNSSPSAVWEPLDWQSAEERVNVYNSWEGCPASLSAGAQFLGAGYLELHSDVFCGGMDFEISLKFRTDQANGLLLFIHNTDSPDFLVAELRRGVLSFRLNTSLTFTQVDLRLGLSYCDGKWNEVLIKKEGALLTAGLNALTERYSAPGARPLVVNSPVYIGGIPQQLRGAYGRLSLEQGFGGCVKDVTFARGAVVKLASVSSVAVRVNLDGCLSPASAANCRGNDSILVFRGCQQSAADSGLQPFTEYLYRVRASHEGGVVCSDWSRGRTMAAAPSSVPAPSRVRSIDGYSVEVTWAEPVGVGGVVEKYVLRAYSGHSPPVPQTPSASAEFVDTTSFTAPQEVQSPVANSFPSSLLLSWSPPRRANGVITGYSLHMDGRLIYSGRGENYMVTDLGPFTSHRFVLSTCTLGGCTNSSGVTLHTAQLPPEHVACPVLTSLDSRAIHAQWKQPQKLNGILERYVLYVSNHTYDFTVWTVIYNSSELLQDHVLRDLTPGNRYRVKLGACTGGGCTVSEASQALTHEDIPEGVATPEAPSYSPGSFNISWTQPEYPNGVITSYGLYLDGILIHSSSELSCYVHGLALGSLHSFRVQACTARGCGLGPLVENRTLEAPPEGTVNVSVRAEGPQEARVKWGMPQHPNGHLTYSVHVTGIFYADQAGNNYTLLSGTKVMHSSEAANLWVPVVGLVPFSNYTVQVNASNSRGSLVSEPVTITTPPGAPDGVLPPRLSSATPTSLQVVWSTPARNNAPGPPQYQLQMRLTRASLGFRELFPNPSASLSYEVSDLQPYTEYEFRLVASNAFGSAHSSWIPLLTAEDAPGPMEPPILQDVQSRTMSVTWNHPSKPNGVITHYNVYQRGRRLLRTSGNVTNCTVVHLQPNTAYTFQVEACSSQGCSLSPESRAAWTLPGPPGGILSQELFSDTATSVVISWQPPSRPSGSVEHFTIERREKGKEGAAILVTLPGNHSRSFIDKTPALSPWTKYEYRVLASTLNGGTTSSAWGEVTTRPSRPLGVQPPDVQVLGPDSAKVTWKAPLVPNGDILSYEIRVPDPHTTVTKVAPSELSQVITQLTPFTNYSITIVACTGGNGHFGGCTESLPTLVTTGPAAPQGVSLLSAIPFYESYVGISWHPPSKPNGPDLRYELLRRKTQQPLASNPPKDLNLWLNIYSGTQWFYEDKGLSRFTTYEYKLLVHNRVGFTPSQEATVTTLAGFPERGTNITVSVLNHTAIDVKWAKPKSLEADNEKQISGQEMEKLGGKEGKDTLGWFLKGQGGDNDELHLQDRPFLISHDHIVLHLLLTAFQDLQGDVEYYTLFWSSSTSNESLRILPGTTSYVIGHLNPNTEYWIFISVFNGVHSINSTVLQATTHDGEPRGMQPPEVVIINRTAARVIWSTPSDPNVVVTEYSVYVNDKLYKTGMDVPGSLILRDLSPFTIYDIQVEVCTKYVCTKSSGTQVTTVEDTPGDIATPSIRDVTSRSLRIDWVSPGKPKGIILGYDLLRKTWRPCSETRKLMEKHSSDLCKVVKCPKPLNICGHTCFSPEAKVCCNGALYEPQPGYHCCEENYIPFLPNSTGACCGGRVQEAQPDHECCYGHYAKVLPGEICCPDEQHGRVSVGRGDACCGRTPCSSSGHQLCCAGTLHDGRGQQCCGG